MLTAGVAAAADVQMTAWGPLGESLRVPSCFLNCAGTCDMSCFSSGGGGMGASAVRNLTGNLGTRDGTRSRGRTPEGGRESGRSEERRVGKECPV